MRDARHDTIRSCVAHVCAGFVHYTVRARPALVDPRCPRRIISTTPPIRLTARCLFECTSIQRMSVRRGDPVTSVVTD